ncbi:MULTISPECIES: divergent PAP2 family protein [Kyrpidia]|nr:MULTISPECIES: divergent PAP2 family protein [Kyrpidia]MCL6576071.1 divergent PAP2 family protein [Kyrpidia sp.]
MNTSWNLPLLSALASMLVAQGIKIPFQRWREKAWNWRLAFCSGGMPSSHAAVVSALAVAMGLSYGWNSPWFAVSSVFATVVLYDAVGVRRQAGQQAVVLYELVNRAQEAGIDLSGVAAAQARRWVHRGHTPLEVAGGVTLGTSIACLVYLMAH